MNFLVFSSATSYNSLWVHIFSGRSGDTLLVITINNMKVNRTPVKIISFWQPQQMENFSIKSQTEKVKVLLFIVSSIWSLHKNYFDQSLLMWLSAFVPFSSSRCPVSLVLDFLDFDALPGQPLTIFHMPLQLLCSLLISLDFLSCLKPELPLSIYSALLDYLSF